MPNTFSLTGNNKTYTLNTDGTFTEGARTGAWGVLDNGNVEIRPTGAAAESVPAQWAFDDKNHLIIEQNKTKAFDFTADDPKLEIELAANVLQVWPNGANNFKVELPFVWAPGPNFQKDGKIQATLNSRTSIVSGRADKVANRFVYVFRRTDGGAGPVGPRPIRLTFVGSWKNSADATPGGVDVWFEYAIHNQAFKFEFPKGLWTVDPTKGTLYVEYGSGPGKQRIEINGEFQIGEKAHLSITFTQDVAGGTTTNTLTFATQFALGKQDNPASLALTIADSTAPGGVRTLSVGGQFTYKSEKLGLTIGFTYKSSSGASVPRTVDLSVVLEANVGPSKVSLKVNSTGGVTTIDFNLTDVKFSDGVSATLGLNVTLNGKQKYISGVLGLSW